MGIFAFHIEGYGPEDYVDLFSDLTDESQETVKLRAIEHIEGVSVSTEKDIKRFVLLRDRIKFVFISRKDSLGYLEFVRGRYDEDQPETIVHLFKQMMPSEIERISKATSFEDVTRGVLEAGTQRWHDAKTSWDALCAAEEPQKSLKWYVENIRPRFITPEIGAPRGRRKGGETGLYTAMREFQEETGLKQDDYTVLNRVSPLREPFKGTDGNPYLNIYYLAYMDTIKELRVDENREGQKNEIGEVFYCGYDEAMKLIRPYHIERLKILAKIFSFIMGRLLKLENMREKERKWQLAQSKLHQEEEGDRSTTSSSSEDDVKVPFSRTDVQMAKK
jgi:8-oxo-dGTP pyrophosphatase MutT (NUDIX family)